MNLTFIPDILYLPLAILCSIMVATFLKVAKRYNIVADQAIATNFLVALGLMILYFNPTVPEHIKTLPWVFFVPLAIVVSAAYIFLSKAIDHGGIARTMSMQSLASIIPVLAGTLLSRQLPAQPQLVAIGVMILGVCFLLARNEKKINPKQAEIPAQKAQLTQQATEQARATLFARFFLLCVLVSYGIASILLAKLSNAEVIYALLFCFAFGFVFMVLFVFLCYQTWTLKSALSGIILGIFYFFSLLFFLKAQQHFSANPAHFFSSYHLVMIVLSLFIGLLIFREKLGRINLLGIIVSLIAIAIHNEIVLIN